MWTDNETTTDLLGFRVHADLIREVVTDPGQLPVTVGVFADWGGGKTSLMKMLEESFDPETWGDDDAERERCERTACLYFNGWLFEGYDDAKSAILSSVIMSLGEHKRFGPKVRDGCVSLLKSVNWMRVAHLGLKHVAVPAISAYATGGASLVPALAGAAGGLLPWGGGTTGGRAEPPAATAGPGDSGESDGGDDGDNCVDWASLMREQEGEAGPLDVRTFREQFGQLLKNSDIDSLVVLIDDLDRCSPGRIIENLEAIKLFLNVDNTAFVIGADPRIVRHAISWKYHHHEEKSDVEAEAPTIVTDYLEKLIQLPYRLPRLSPAEIETYMALLFCQAYLEDGDFRVTVARCDEHRDEDRYSVFGYSGVKQCLPAWGCSSVPDDLEAALTFSSHAASLITDGLKGNPRQVKRFLNAFVLRKRLARVAKLENIDDAVLVKLMILEYANETRFRELFDWQARQKGQPRELASMEEAGRGDGGDAGNEAVEQKGENVEPVFPGAWDTPALRRWVAMDPSLAGIDLRDYFWVARDRLQSSVAGVSMIPPLVRRTAKGLTNPESSGSIREATAVAARGFDEDEREMLYELLKVAVNRHPDQLESYNAYRSLIEADIPEAPARFGEVLLGVPAAVTPPSLGLDLQTLIKAKPGCEPALAPAMEKLAESSGRIGKAIRAGKKGKL